VSAAAAPDVAAAVPFTILTGFLGAGKTSTLNRVLAAPQGRRVAVLVNELGRVAIDSRLILSEGGDVLELAGGCVCCKLDVKNDLWDGIVDVVTRSAPDHVVLETTGIAEPDAIVAGMRDRAALLAGRVELAGVICAVDADAALGQLERRAEAVAQVRAADRLLLTKLDIVSPAALGRLHARLEADNAEAERAAFPRTEEGTAALVRWLLEARSPRARALAHRHDHLGQLCAATFVATEPLLAEPLLGLVGRLRGQLLRVKGFVHVAGEQRAGYLELAGNQLELRLGEPWAGRRPRTELVLIGEGLDEVALRRQLWACRAERASEDRC
jgi:G3E family GTPase